MLISSETEYDRAVIEILGRNSNIEVLGSRIMKGNTVRVHFDRETGGFVVGVFKPNDHFKYGTTTLDRR